MLSQRTSQTPNLVPRGPWRAKTPSPAPANHHAPGVRIPAVDPQHRSAPEATAFRSSQRQSRPQIPAAKPPQSPESETAYQSRRGACFRVYAFNSTSYDQIYPSAQLLRISSLASKLLIFNIGSDHPPHPRSSMTYHFKHPDGQLQLDMRTLTAVRPRLHIRVRRIIASLSILEVHP